MNNKELCVALVNCETEKEVIDILESAKYWNDESLWRFYGDNENNFATIGNQMSRPEAAIVEKIINSVDAMLLSECMLREIDPESNSAPQSIVSAQESYFNIPDGKLSNLTLSERRKLAENICLVATGKKLNPCYSIIDKGEGQTPKMMPETLLSIGKSNKLRIPFVQGKFNMGGTGVFRFCGERNLQLIISKRHPDISKNEDDPSSHLWGFTIVRREDPKRGVRSSSFRYLAPVNNILTFDAKSLPLLPGKYPIAYEMPLEHGTFIKLYEYQMTGLKTNIKLDLYYRLSLSMPSIALPIRLYERRKGYKGHTQEANLSGLTVRLEEDKFANLEDGYPTSSPLSVHGQKMKIKIFVFKRNRSEKYTKNEGVIFVVNGQTHGNLKKGFFSRNRINLGYLADSLLVLVDCTEFEGRAREDLFMNSRDRLSAGELRNKIVKGLEDVLRDHPGLRALRERRRREDIENKLEDSKPLAGIIENLVKKSPTLSKLFIQGVTLSNPFKIEKAETQKSFKGQQYPTHFKLINEFSEKNPKNCPINMRLRVQYSTDASNDYFDRDLNPGSFLLDANNRAINDFSLNLWNGTANLNVTLPTDTKVGGKIHFINEVYDDSRIDPFSDNFFVIVESEAKKPSGSQGIKKLPPSDKPGNDVEKISHLDLPNIMEVRMHEWEKYKFDRESALKVINSGEDGYDFYINMDNVHLLTEKKSTTDIDTKIFDARYKYGLALFGIALLKDNESSNLGKNNEINNGEDIYKKIYDVSKAVSPILLPMITGLGDLREDEIDITFEE